MLSNTSRAQNIQGIFVIFQFQRVLKIIFAFHAILIPKRNMYIMYKFGHVTHVVHGLQ